MKVRISIPGLYTAMEMDEEKAFRAFRKLNEVLLSHGGGQNDKKAEVKVEKPEISVSYGNQESIREVPELEKNMIVDVEYPEPTHQKYRGFMYMRCPECGEIKGFNMKNESDYFHCSNCGKRIILEKPLVPLFVRCECGRQFRYLTNLTEMAFDIPCLECGAPVAVQWNDKKEVYETI